MKKTIKQIIMKMLAFATVFVPFEKGRAADSPQKSDLDARAELTFFNNLEQDGSKPLYAETCLLPNISIGKGDKKIGFQGCYWRFGDTKGDITDWWRLATHVNFETEDLRLRVGRVLVREYAGYVYSPTTPRFDNISTAKGVGMGFTGLNFEHKPTGLGFGITSSNNQMNPNDWDTGYLTWHRDVSDELAIQAHLGATHNELTRAGLTAKWKPSKDLTIVAEGIYKGKEMSEFLTANYQIVDGLKAYGGVLMTHPETGKMSGLASIGLDYHIGKSGVHLFAGVHQELGGKGETSAVVGARFQGVVKAAQNALDYHGF